MSTVYINLHPDYSYAIAIIQGYVDVREYVKNVDWLTWDNTSRAGTRKIMISGILGDHEKAKVQHLERAAVFGQRMVELGAEVLIRDERGDEWRHFISPKLTPEALLKAECERDREPDQERWKREKIEKYKGLLEKAQAVGHEHVSQVEQMIREEEESLLDLQRAELERQAAIKTFWGQK